MDQGCTTARTARANDKLNVTQVLLGGVFLFCVLGQTALSQTAFLGLGPLDINGPVFMAIGNGGTFSGAVHTPEGPRLVDIGNDVVSAAVPADFVDAACASATDFLLARDVGASTVLEHWETSAGQLFLRSSVVRALPGADFGELLYEPSTASLYWADDARQVIEVASWSPPASLMGLTWSMLVDNTVCPSFAICGEFYVVADSAGNPVPFWGEFSGGQTLCGYRLDGAPGPVTVVWQNLLAATSALVPPAPAIEWQSLSEGDIGLWVEGDGATSVEIVKRSSGAVVGSAVMAGGQRTYVPPTEAAVIGEEYVPRTPQGAWGASAVCMKRYLNTGITGSGLQFQPVPHPLGLEIGNLNFVLRIPLTQSPPSPTPVVLNGIGLAGVTSRTSGGQDPVILISQGWTVDPNYSTYLPTYGAIEDGTGWLECSLPIPNDPALQGAIGLFQMAVDDGTGVILSDIIAARIP